MSGPEPDWSQPVQITAAVAETFARVSGSPGGADAVTADLARAGAERGLLGEVAARALAAAWQNGDLTVKDGRVALVIEDEEARLRRRLEQLSSPDRKQALRAALDTLRELLGDGDEGEHSEPPR